MRHRRRFGLAMAATAAVTLAITQAGTATADSVWAPAPQQAPLTPAEAAALAQDTNTPVIVLLRDQPASAAKSSPAATTRSNAIASAQAPVLSELGQVRAKGVHGFRLADAVSATVSKGEAARLAANPAVAAVVPDSLVKGAPTGTPATGAQSTGSAQAPAAVCPAPGRTMLEPEALPVTGVASDDPAAKTARSLGYTGTGVKVAYIAEGIDTNNPDFIRADGSHVFADYQDFSGDGPTAPTSGGEAFLDASAIAAQGRQVYDVSHFGAHPLPTPCDIRILGVAPGASLYGFRAFSDAGYSTTSSLLQSIDYATNVDHVDVLNESFGYNPFSDNSAQDAVKLFNDAAVAAGVTVTVSSGDAGTTSTQGSPSTDPNVISVGASTTFRWYAQTDYGAAGTFAKSGWLNDNVSSLSSSGFTQNGRTIDLLAPGDSSFALCTPNPGLYASCADFNGKPSSVERSGGTSESAPLTAGAAALVIQAYRQAHGGASPGPALVKQIITSTADDLTEPGDEQGAGRLNAYRAVQAAASVRDSHGAPAATGSSLLVSRSQLDATGAPGSTQRWTVQVTNTGAAPRDVRLSGRSFGPRQHQQTGSVTLSDSASPHFADWSGHRDNYGTLTFSVPQGADRLSASIAYPGNPNASLNARVRLILIDPLGRFAAHSLPQGVGNYGNVDVRFPAAGTWTAVVYSIASTGGGTVGTVGFAATTSNTTGFGTVSPADLNLAPGQTGTVTVTAPTPAAPGDESGSLVLASGGDRTSVPIAVRALVQPTHGGAFSGTLTGGNGRQPDLGQGQFYQLDVPGGRKDVRASVNLTNDAGDNVAAFLVDPHGQVVSSGVNRLTTAFDPATRSATQTAVTQTDVYARNPAPGRWTLIVNFAGAIVGDELSQAFHGSVGFDAVDVHATGLPNGNGTTLAAGTPVTVGVTVHNTGSAPQDLFVDPRLDGLVALRLAAAEPATIPVPMPGNVASPAWLVPSETSGVAVLANATQPITFDYGPEAGDPDLAAAVTGTTAIGAVHANPLPAGMWAADPTELGPIPVGGGKPGTVSFEALALTKAFDPSVTSPAGDLWASSTAPATSLGIVTVAPGATATIPVTITPSAPKGTVVTGTLYVDNLVAGATPIVNAINYADPAATEPTAGELTGIPYEYTVG